MKIKVYFNDVVNIRWLFVVLEGFPARGESVAVNGNTAWPYLLRPS